MGWTTRIVAILRTLHWRRGVRAGFAVAAAMVVCRLLGKPMGWAALGGFEAVLVDNGGPYRSRLNTMATVIFGGALCGLIGALVPSVLIVGVLVTALVCFAVTFARVAAQPIASTSVIILVIYFAGFGGSAHSLAGALGGVTEYMLGGFWAAAISLFLWPVDPFRPAREGVAACYELLAGYTAQIHVSADAHASHDEDHTTAVGFKRQLRTKLEAAHAALGTTGARMSARTVRARSLSVLLETADMLFAATVRLTELAEVSADGSVADRGPIAAGPTALEEIAHWLSGAERAVAYGLRAKPADDAASFAAEGSHRMQYVTQRRTILDTHTRSASGTDTLLPHLVADERDELQNIEIAFEALHAVWTGVETLPGGGGDSAEGEPQEETFDALTLSPAWLDALRQNWTLESTAMRHALRIAAVGAADVVLMHTVHVAHGFWLAMTSIIVLQPYSTGTLRKSLERVGGTIAGGVLAALLAALIHSYAGIIVVITVCSVLTLATYAIDYGWYSFFLTPTFVLMSLPYLRIGDLPAHASSLPRLAR